MIRARIRFSADILRRLGEELNPSIDKGIVELVKNAYDADATWCRVELKDVYREGGSITVSDNGVGMTPSQIETGWLVLGTSTKSVTRRTPLGRIPAGNKGLGRLAALRLGSRALLTTRPDDDLHNEYQLYIDWNDYTSTRMVDDVQLEIDQTARHPNAINGTDILIEPLTRRIRRMEVKRLARELILLADPFGQDPSGFTPELAAPDFDDLASLVTNRYFRDAEYHLCAGVNADGYATASVVDWRGEKLFAADHDQLPATNRDLPFRCPVVSFDLWVFILNSQTFSTRNTTLQEVRDWLTQFGGVHVYHNGLRVAPYGNTGNDWLDMNLSRVRSPEERPGTNTSIGRVKVTDTGSILAQKTDRSGYVEDEAYADLVRFAQSAMEWMADRRLEIAEKRRAVNRSAAPKRARKAQQTVEAAIEGLSPKAREPLSLAFAQYERSRDREIAILQREVQLYRTLSTVGITAATFAHESKGNPIKVIRQSSDAIARRGKRALGDSYVPLLAQPIGGIKKALDSLDVLGDATLKLLNHEKRRPSRVDLHKVCKDVLVTFRPFLDIRNVTVTRRFCPGNPYVRGQTAAMESVVTNILNNSVAAFESTGTMRREIELSTTVEDMWWQLTLSDSGPGIDSISKTDIWLPGRTTRKNGTGLGLTIVRDAINDFAGEVDAREHGALGGADIIARIPLLGV